MTLSPIKIRSQPGVKRDGTSFDGNFYSDAQWCRFSRGLPRKMQGYQSVTDTVPEISRGLDIQSLNGVQYIHSGGTQFFNQVQVDPTGIFLGQHDRTPSAFVPNPNNVWQIEVMYNSITTVNSIIAYPGQNLTNIDSNATSTIYIGQVDATTALVDANAGGLVSPESGGICVIAPYLIKFGSSGHVAWSVPNEPTDFNGTGSGDAFVTGTKIVKALPIRGSNESAILWSLDSVVIMTANPNAQVAFSFNTPSVTSTVLSTRGILEYDSVYFWAGIDRFYIFNGVLQELPNAVSIDWFLDNVNMNYRQKVFAFRVPRRGEIWWCFPFGNAVECTHAIIYNVREQCWYDTILPIEGRSAAAYSKVYGKPFLTDTTPIGTNYSLWQHEVGFDKVVNTQVNPIESYFETHQYSLLTVEKPIDKTMHVMSIEPDFRQAGDMTVQVRGQSNVRAPVLDGPVYPIPVTATSQTQIVNAKDLKRLMSFKFTSNTAGGDYFLGETIAMVDQADGRSIT